MLGEAQVQAWCRMPVVARPGLVLKAEEELGITAGLQDRVVQVYGGIVYMEFARDLMQRHGHGRCCPEPENHQSFPETGCCFQKG